MVADSGKPEQPCYVQRSRAVSTLQDCLVTSGAARIQGPKYGFFLSAESRLIPASFCRGLMRPRQRFEGHPNPVASQRTSSHETIVAIRGSDSDCKSQALPMCVLRCFKLNWCLCRAGVGRIHTPPQPLQVPACELKAERRTIRLLITDDALFCCGVLVWQTTGNDAGDGWSHAEGD